MPARTENVLHAVRTALEETPRLILSVSGGIDSMVLLDAASRVRPAGCALVVATVDHGTGISATEAAALVCAEAARRGLNVRSERLSLPAASEAEWRAARWEWLRRVGEQERAPIATAHTRDDHVETVVMRLLRGAGARGIAALHAPGSIRRPLLDLTRADVKAYADAVGLPYVEDPSNAERRFLRNRVRLELLPAVRLVRPDFESGMLELSRRAAEVRRAMDAVASSFVRAHVAPGCVDLDAVELGRLPEGDLRELWPALAAVAGVALDRRGTERLARFTRDARAGDRMPLSGRFEVIRGRGELMVRPFAPAAPREPVLLSRAGRFGRFRFQAFPGASFRGADRDPWFACLPNGSKAWVRAWVPGDRLTLGTGSARRVKRFFADAGIPGPLREGWPVVEVDGAIVWIPGICRSPFVDSMKRRNLTIYHCESYSR